MPRYCVQVGAYHSLFAFETEAQAYRYGPTLAKGRPFLVHETSNFPTLSFFPAEKTLVVFP